MRNNGFTLIEILIVCVMAAVLVALIVPKIAEEMNKGSESEVSGSTEFGYEYVQVTVLPREDDDLPSFQYGNKRLVEVTVLVPSDCSQIREVRYTTHEGKEKCYNVEIDAVWIVTPDLGPVEQTVIWEPFDWSQLPDHLVVLHDSESLRLLHDSKTLEQ